MIPSEVREIMDLIGEDESCDSLSDAEVTRLAFIIYNAGYRKEEAES